jgi:hypothetical protein
LKIFHHQSQPKWDEDLPWLSTVFNTAIHESTQSSPDKLFLGRELLSPLLTKWDLTLESGVNDQSFWADAYACVKKARNRVRVRYDAGRSPNPYKVGDTVVFRMRLVSSKPNMVSAKLLLRWSKPVIIAEVVRPNVVLLADPATGVIVRRAHISQLNHIIGNLRLFSFVMWVCLFIYSLPLFASPGVVEVPG